LDNCNVNDNFDDGTFGSSALVSLENYAKEYSVYNLQLYGVWAGKGGLSGFYRGMFFGYFKSVLQSNYENISFILVFYLILCCKEHY
jgi:hypothetical protein